MPPPGTTLPQHLVEQARTQRETTTSLAEDASRRFEGTIRKAGADGERSRGYQERFERPVGLHQENSVPSGGTAGIGLGWLFSELRRSLNSDPSYGARGHGDTYRPFWQQHRASGFGLGATVGQGAQERAGESSGRPGSKAGQMGQ